MLHAGVKEKYDFIKHHNSVSMAPVTVSVLQEETRTYTTAERLLHAKV